MGIAPLPATELPVLRAVMDAPVAGTIFAALADMPDDDVATLMSAVPALRRLAAEVATHLGSSTPAV